MSFLMALGLAGENTFCHSQASPSGASPNPSATTNRTANEKYGLDAICEERSFLIKLTVWPLVWLKSKARTPPSRPVFAPFIPLYELLAARTQPNPRWVRENGHFDFDGLNVSTFRWWTVDLTCLIPF